MDKNEIAFLKTIVYRSPTHDSTPEFTTNQQIRNNICTTIQLTLEIIKNLSLTSSSLDAEYAQKITILKRKLKKYKTD